jgi:hypothetical protein
MFHRRDRSRGQTLVEFAIVLPVLLFMLLGALDLGRVFMGWVVLNNAARVGANYAAAHPNAWATPGNATQRATYEQLIRDAFVDANCALPGAAPGTVPAPTFPTGRDLGDTASVALTCIFRPLTPIIGGIVGNSLNVTGTAIFPIRTGVIDGPAVPPAPGCPALAAFSWTVDAVDPLKVYFTDTSTGAPTAWAWSFGDGFNSSATDPVHTYAAGGSYTATLTVNGCSSISQTVSVTDPVPSPDPGVSPSPSPSASPSPLPSPGCTVPGFIGTKRNNAQATWTGAGFTTTVLFNPDPNGNWTIEAQSLVGGRTVPCNSVITLGPDPIPSPAP